MDLTPEVVTAMRKAIRAHGSVAAFSRECGIGRSMVDRYLEPKPGQWITDGVWARMYPVLRDWLPKDLAYMPPEHLRELQERGRGITGDGQWFLSIMEDAADARRAVRVLKDVLGGGKGESKDEAVPIGPPSYPYYLYGLTNAASLDADVIYGDIPPDGVHACELRYSRDPRVCAGFITVGESMEPEIRDGDELGCMKVADLDELRNGSTVVARWDDVARVKRYHRIGDTVLLQSTNRQKGEDYEVAAGELEWITKVLEINRKMED